MQKIENMPLLAGNLVERRREFMTHKTWRAFLAEFFGTLFYVHFICGAILSSGGNWLVIAAVNGLSIAALNKTFTEFSGAYFNPVVSLAAFMVGEISFLRTLGYIFAEVMGALLGVVFLYCIMPHSIADSVTFHGIATTIRYDMTLAEGLFMEAIGTFAFILVILLVDITQYKKSVKPFTPVIIGAMLAAIDLFAGPFTGSSLNPARSFGAAIVTNCWENHWIYWVGPFLGCLLATLFFKIFETHWHDVDRDRLKPEEPVRPTVIISE
jgi:MIP family channel proteins